MTDTTTTLRQARENTGLGRERVAPQLEPAISAKTLERWEKAGGSHVPRWRLEQLAVIYGVKIATLLEPDTETGSGQPSTAKKRRSAA